MSRFLYAAKREWNLVHRYADSSRVLCVQAVSFWTMTKCSLSGPGPGPGPGQDNVQFAIDNCKLRFKSPHSQSCQYYCIFDIARCLFISEFARTSDALCSTNVCVSLMSNIWMRIIERWHNNNQRNNIWITESLNTLKISLLFRSKQKRRSLNFLLWRMQRCWG